MAGEINFNLLDPNAPAKVSNAFFQGRDEMQQAQQNALANKLAQLKFGQMQQEVSDSNTLRDLYRNSIGADGNIDRSALLTGAAKNGLGAQIPGMTKTFADLDKSTADAQTAKLGLFVKATEAHRDDLSNVKTPEDAVAWLKQGYDDPITGPFLKKGRPFEQAAANIPTDPAQLQSWVQQQALGATKYIEQNKPLIQTRDTGGTVDTLQIDPGTGKVKVLNSIRKTQSPESIAADAREKSGKIVQTDNGPILVDPVSGTGKPITGPDGKQLPGQSKPLTEGQANALLFGTRMQEADRILKQLEAEGTTTNFRGSSFVPNNFISNNQQMLTQAKKDFMTAVLRRESGAAISDGEFKTADKQYFPQPGDGPDVIAQKARNRELAIQGVLVGVPEKQRTSITPKAAPSTGVKFLGFE